MTYNFDKIIDRRKTDSLKWNNLKDSYGSGALLPMWIADMDFESPREIIDAMKERVDHGVFGYPYIGDDIYDIIIAWAKKRYNWDLKKEWIIFTPGVVTGLNIGIKEIGEKGDNVVVQSPVYPPFFKALENHEKELNVNPIIFKDGKFLINFEELKKKINDKTKIMMLCNPHNPVGRAWTREELIHIGEICTENDIIIISDEIHCDLTLKGVKHIPIASISPELEDKTITLMSPSKSFNIAGLFTSIAIIPNEKLRSIYIKSMEGMGIGHTPIFGIVGLKAAYGKGEKWLNEALIYIEANIDFAIKYIQKEIPEIKLAKPEATYLLWLDFRALNKSADEIEDALINTGKIILNDGRPYGVGGEGFFRLNVGCARSILEDGLDRIKRTVEVLR